MRTLRNATEAPNQAPPLGRPVGGYSSSANSSCNVIHGLNSARWTVETLPSDWSGIRNRWEAFHAARTFISLAGFGSALAAALWSREDATPLV